MRSENSKILSPLPLYNRVKTVYNVINTVFFVCVFAENRKLWELNMEKFFEQSGCVGVLDPRAYYVPFRSGEDVFADRKESGRFADLGGEWGITGVRIVLRRSR